MIEVLKDQYGKLFELPLLEEIGDAGVVKRFPAGTVLMDIGEYVRSIPLLIKGAIKIMRLDDDGDELLLYFLEQGDTCAMTMSCCLGQTISEIRDGGMFGLVGGYGWEWINACYLLGGLALLRLRVIQWHIPVSLLGSLLLASLVFYLLNPEQYTPPQFQLFSGATMLAAFFIATDPVSASTTPRGRLLFGAGIGLLIFVIRTWGGYPDGVAFAVLLMNMAAPVIDHYTQPRVF